MYNQSSINNPEPQILMEPDTSPLPEETREKNRRPANLALLVGYLVFFGGILFALQLSAYKNIRESGVSMDYSPLLLLISIIFLGLLALTAGTGLWWGQKWGWWLSAFYFLHALSRQVETLFGTGLGNTGWTRSWLGVALGLLFSLVVLLYLNSREILAHFHLEQHPRWKSLLVLLIPAILLTLVF